MALPLCFALFLLLLLIDALLRSNFPPLHPFFSFSTFQQRCLPPMAMSILLCNGFWSSDSWLASWCVQMQLRVCSMPRLPAALPRCICLLPFTHSCVSRPFLFNKKIRQCQCHSSLRTHIHVGTRAMKMRVQEPTSQLTRSVPQPIEPNEMTPAQATFSAGEWLVAGWQECCFAFRSSVPLHVSFLLFCRFWWWRVLLSSWPLFPFLGSDFPRMSCSSCLSFPHHPTHKGIGCVAQ